MKNQKLIFAIEALKITFLCLLTTFIFKWFGASTHVLLVTFTTAVMIGAATFSPEKKKPLHILIGALVMTASILLGGVVGFYWPILGKVLVIFYAIFAFLLPNKRFYTNIFVTSAIMFLIFSSLPFDINIFNHLLPFSVALIPIAVFCYWIIDKYAYQFDPYFTHSDTVSKHKMALIAGIAIILAIIIEVLLGSYTHLQHLYWVGLTSLVVIQGSGMKTIKTSLIRIGVNTAGAVIIVILMTYIMPSSFLINFALLSVFLFCIFALGYSYILRTLFIELFVLGFTHLMGHYHNTLAYDRVILTLIGGLIVIASTFLSYGLQNFVKKK